MHLDRRPSRPPRPVLGSSMPEQRNSRRGGVREQGFTLIESLVALLVLSIGLIGVAALHGQALNASRTAVYRTTAINLGSDMAERIRVNRTAGAAYENEPANPNCARQQSARAVGCTAAEMAKHDREVWEGNVADALPNGTGTVAVNESTDPTTYTITINWDEVGQGQLSHTTQFELSPF